ncbi:MAG: haloacid dehalogenase-like hydrolase [Acidobacteria bacterium]|jgi:phosphoglycolate phosphatase-like HAD superfamily hydrolase|nr:haloacid dehalogenase-like hydrolase [Acidobacteriota bacterium]
MSKKFLLFDIDGTLVHAGGAGRRALNAALAEAGVKEEAVRPISFAGRTDRQIVLSALRASGFSGNDLPALLAQVLDSYVRRLAANLAGQPVRVYPLAGELLRACCGRPDLEPALLTGNIPQGARLKLESAGLWGHFAWGVFGDHSEEREELAREAQRRIGSGNGGIDARDVFVIGDTTADIACGRAIGATTVAMISDFECEENLRAAAPDHLLRDFRPLFGLLGLPLPAEAP